MRISLKRKDEAFNLEAENEDGKSVSIDASEASGGSNKGMRPMQLILAALASCSAMDLISLLNKKRMPLKDIQIEVDGKRAEDVYPSPFTDIHLTYILSGELDFDKTN